MLIESILWEEESWSKCKFSVLPSQF